MRLRVSAVFLPHFFSLKNEKYSAAVASASWLTDAAYPLRVHTVFLHFSNFELEQKSWLSLLAELCGVALRNSIKDVHRSGFRPTVNAMRTASVWEVDTVSTAVPVSPVVLT